MKHKINILWLLILLITLPLYSFATKVNDIWSGWQAGELSPLLDGQVNMNEYKFGAKTLTNFIPYVQGPAANRSGFKYIASARYATATARLIPFEFSTDQSYILEFGNQYIRFYMNGGQIQTVDSNTTLYLRMNGTDAATTFTDESSTTTPYTVTATDNAQIDTAYYKFGGASGLFDGSADYLSVPDGNDWNYASGTTTVDFWVRFATTTGQHSFYNQASGTEFIAFYQDHTRDRIVFSVSTSTERAIHQEGVWNPETDTWYHVALIRGWGGNVNDWAIAIDGQATSTFTDVNTMPDLTSALWIGYTPLTSVIDHGNTGHPITFTNQATLSTTGKFGNGGLSFDGTGDYISAPDHADWDVVGSSSDNWTIDFFVKFTDHVGAETIVAQNVDGDNNWDILHDDGSGWKFAVNSSATTIINTGSGGEITDTNWHHVALIKVANKYAVYVDGTQVNYTMDSSTATFASPLYIGSKSASSNFLDGKIDELRIQNSNPFSASPNVAKTNTITVPTSPHTSDSNTKLLLYCNPKSLNGWLDEYRVSKSRARWTANFTLSTVEYMTTGGTIYEVATTYTESELSELQYTQSADTMIIVHPEHMPAKLTRTGHALWTLTDIAFTNTNLDPAAASTTNSGFGSFSAANLLDGDTATIGFSGDTAASSSAITIDLGSGNSEEYIETRMHTETSGAFITLNVQYSSNGSSWTSAKTGWSLADSAGWHEVSWNSVGAYRYWRFIKSNTAKDGGDVTELQMYVASLPSTWATSTYPSSVVFFENRLWLAYLQTLWASKTGDYYNLSLGTTDDDAMEYTIASAEVNKIQWLSSGKILIAGTAGGEYKISASEQEEAITPSNIRIVKQSSYGSAYIMPLTIRDVTLYVQRLGRKLREFAFKFETNTYVSPDLTILAEHITDSGIKYFAYQQEPYSIVWCVRNDGKLIGMTYARENDTIAWHRHETDGYFESVAVIPSISGNEYEELWVVVKRNVNGSDVRYIEQLQPQFAHDGNIEDAFFVDSGLSYTGVATTTLSGLDHLAGETVAVLYNGAATTTTVSAGGSITINATTTKAHVGLPYTSTLQTMRYAGNSPIGTLQGQEKRINEVVFRLQNAKQFEYGHSATSTLNEKIFPSLHTGDINLSMPLGVNKEGYVAIVNTEPLPITVIAIMPEVNFP